MGMHSSISESRFRVVVDNNEIRNCIYYTIQSLWVRIRYIVYEQVLYS